MKFTKEFHKNEKMNETKQLKNDLNIYLTIDEAISYTKIPLKDWIKFVNSDELPTIDDKKFNNDDLENISLSEEIKIPLSFLPSFIIEQYIKDHLDKSKYFNADFLPFVTKYGKEKLEKLIKDIEILTEINHKKNIGIDTTKIEENIFKDNHHNYYHEFNSLLPLVYDFEASKDFRLEHKETLNNAYCNASLLYAANRKLQKQTDEDMKDINCDLIEESKQQGKEFCSRCPFNENSDSYKESNKEFSSMFSYLSYPRCNINKKEGMTYGSYPTLTRNLKHLPKEIYYFANFGNKAWEKAFGHKITRNKPNLVNEVFFSDHMQLDVLLLYGIDKDKKPIFRKPWITAILDYASGAIVSWILTFTPDSFTIGQCFARACAPKIDSPFMGVPKVFYCDNGKDYRSNFIAGNDKELKAWNSQPHYLNDSIFSEGLIHVLDTMIVFAGIEQPWEKPIERCFRKIQSMMKRVPGFVGGKHRKKLAINQQMELERLLKSNRILNIEKFSIIFEKVINSYNNYKRKGDKSAFEKYNETEKANTLIPSWNSLAVFLSFKNKYKYYPSGGIKIKKSYYEQNNNGTIEKKTLDLHYISPKIDPALSEYVYVYSLNDYISDSIFCVYEDKSNHKLIYLGEAFLEKNVDTIEKNYFKLSMALLYRNLQRQQITKTITAIRFFSQKMNFIGKHYLDENFKDEIDAIGPTIDELNSIAKPISEDSLQISIEIEKKKLEILNKQLIDFKR